MNIVECITLRSGMAVSASEMDALMASLEESIGRSEKVTFSVYSDPSVPNDICIFLSWEQEGDELPQKSLEGLLVEKAFENHGLVSHTIYKQR